jgi:lipopolysaccharide/colanic/teichoic acid biosynthesis glycosyltransferase
MQQVLTVAGLLTDANLTPGFAAAPVAKRILDLALLAILAPVILPVMAVVAVGIWLVSPGRVFFRQERVGLRGRRFLCYKFRIMQVDADPATHQQHLQRLLTNGAAMRKMDAARDPRLIPGGALLRATGLDELPQLLNVLRGEMSLVGPRPCIPYEFELYPPAGSKRFETLPGLTGLWQVSGKNRTTFDEMLALDAHYVRNQSLWMDVSILLRTPLALVQEVVDTVGSSAPSRQPQPRRLEATLPS